MPLLHASPQSILPQFNPPQIVPADSIPRPGADPDFPGEAEYTWRLDGAVLKISTMFPPARRTPASKTVTAIEIAVGRGSARVLTEHGLQFGDTLQVRVQTYGWRYVTHWRRSAGAESGVATFIFQDESELSAAFDDDGRLVRLFVAASVE